MSEENLTAPYVYEYEYRRSLGPVISRFLSGLREGHVVGIRTAVGRVLVPPVEYDPETGAQLDELVLVGNEGIVTSWTWIDAPRPKHPLKVPFAFALVKLDGADTAMLHAVDAGHPRRMVTGLRVRARWAPERKGSILDIACFEPVEGGLS